MFSSSFISESTRALPVLITAFFLGLFLFYRGFVTLRKKRKIEHTPTSKIRSISLGEVEIAGETLEAKEMNGVKIMENISAIAPFSNKKCVYYYTLIEEHRQEGKNSRWVTIHKKVYQNPFYVVDDTGKVLVNPKGAQIEVPVDFEEMSGFGRDPSAPVKKYLEENNLNFEGFLGMNKKMRFTERIVAVGDKVYVFGDAMPSGNMSSVGCENIIIGKKHKNNFFLISDRSEKDVLKVFGRNVFFQIYGGAAISTAALAFFLAVMGG